MWNFRAFYVTTTLKLKSNLRFRSCSHPHTRCTHNKLEIFTPCLSASRHHILLNLFTPRHGAFNAFPSTKGCFVIKTSMRTYSCHMFPANLNHVRESTKPREKLCNFERTFIKTLSLGFRDKKNWKKATAPFVTEVRVVKHGNDGKSPE